MALLTPYEGKKKKLVLAFDVGTTYSGISYCLLEPGKVPEVKGVTKFPAQDLAHGSSKIPSVIYYDKEGTVRAIGAETLSAGIYERAQDEGWIKVEWFKLQLRPPVITSSDERVNTFMSALPADKNAIEVLADYYQYLYRCARDFIQNTHPTNNKTGDPLRGLRIEFVLSHPNGWELSQQSQMRKAAVKAKLVPDTKEGHSKISFVTEGEASLCFAIAHCLPLGAVSKNSGVVVVDAGGGTVDMSAYKQTGRGGLGAAEYDEICVRRCHLEGSMFVSRRLETLLRDRLRGSKFFEDVPDMISCFDADTKLRFRAADGPQYIKFGSRKDYDKEHEIRCGQLKLSHADISSCFEPAIDCIVNGIQEMIKAAAPQVRIKRVILLGGFAASDWLYEQVNASMLLVGVHVTRPAFHVSKAVADGAVTFNVGRGVQRQILSMIFGVELSVEYDPMNPEHNSSKADRFMGRDGILRLPMFCIILSKGEAVAREHEVRQQCAITRDDSEKVEDVEVDFLWFYGDPPDGCDSVQLDNKALFSKMCTVNANMAQVNGTSAVKRRMGPKGWYSRFDYEVILAFSGLDMKATIAWDKDGVEKRVDATIVHEDTT